MEGTPIFDELRHLFDSSTSQFESPGLSSRSEAELACAGTERPPSKIIITGGRRVGKTTFVSSVSDTHPINVETVTDFGRITLYPDLVLYLFGTSQPDQSGFIGALGAVVLVDTRCVEDAFPVLSYLERGTKVPFIVALNTFYGELRHELDEVREALALGPEVPLTTCDARDRASSTKTLQELVSYALNH